MGAIVIMKAKCTLEGCKKYTLNKLYDITEIDDEDYALITNDYGEQIWVKFGFELVKS